MAQRKSSTTDSRTKPLSKKDQRKSQAKAAMTEMRLKGKEEVRIKSEERFEFIYKQLEQTKMLMEPILESQKREEGNMKVIMEKVDKVAQFLEGQYEISFRCLEDDNATHQCTIQQYEDKLKYLETENAELKEKFSHSIKHLQDLEAQNAELKNLTGSVVHLRKHCDAKEQKMKDMEKIHPYPAKCMRPECVQRKKELRKQQEELSLPECTKPSCVAREEEMKVQQEKLKMFSPMKEMAVQYNGQHDQLIKKYNELMTDTNPPAILGQLEKIFTDPFDSKVVLTKILMVSYEECKRIVIQSVAQHIKQLFTVQTESDEESGEPSDVDMEDLSRAYGLLLQATASKSRLANTVAMQEICGKIWLKLKLSKTVEKKFEKLPLKEVVDLTWKFVTQNNPLILCQPETFDEDIHRTVFHHWNQEQPEPHTLTYARPVLYRSYHGNIAGRGLVGNIPRKESTI